MQRSIITPSFETCESHAFVYRGAVMPLSFKSSASHVRLCMGERRFVCCHFSANFCNHLQELKKIYNIGTVQQKTEGWVTCGTV